MLTGVEGSNSSSVAKAAGILGVAMLEIVVIEGIRRRPCEVRRVVAGPTLLDGPTVRSTGPTCPVQSRLQGCILSVVFRHAPQLPRTPCSASLGGGGGKREREEEEYLRSDCRSHLEKDEREEKGQKLKIEKQNCS